MYFTILNFIYLLSIVIWIGMIFFTTFFAAPSIFKVLPRESAGEVMGSIFPKYWIIGYVTSLTALGSTIAISKTLGIYPGTRLIILIIMTVLSFISGLVVGSRDRAIKVKLKAADGEAKAKLRKSFGKIHGVSALINLTILGLGFVLIFIMATSGGF
jgi:uncharacterized membrane protein